MFPVKSSWETKIGYLKIFFFGIFQDGYSEQLQTGTGVQSSPFAKQIIAGSVSKVKGKGEEGLCPLHLSLVWH